MIGMLKFWKPREATDELLAPCTQSNRKYCTIIEMK